jgi:hypothetical protein
MEYRLAAETEDLGENLPQRYFWPSQNPTWPDPGLNPGRRGGKPATNRLSYGAAIIFLTLQGPELRPFGHPARSQSLYRLLYLSFGVGIVNGEFGKGPKCEGLRLNCVHKMFQEIRYILVYDSNACS